MMEEQNEINKIENKQMSIQQSKGKRNGDRRIVFDHKK